MVEYKFFEIVKLRGKQRTDTYEGQARTFITNTGKSSLGFYVPRAGLE